MTRIDWHSRPDLKSVENQRKYSRRRSLLILLGSLIPLWVLVWLIGAALNGVG